MEAFVSRYIIRHEFAFLRSLVEAALEIPEYGVGGFEQWCDVQERQRRIRDAKQVDVTRQDEIEFMRVPSTPVRLPIIRNRHSAPTLRRNLHISFSART